MPPVASPETTGWTKISIGAVSEVRASDGVVPAELGRRPRHDDAARLEEVGVIGEVERRRDVLLDEQDAHALLAVDGAHDAEDLAGDERRESERGLVEEEQARPQHERAPDREHLLLAPGEAPGGLTPSLAQHRKIVVDPREVPRRRARRAPRIGAEPEIFLHGELHERPAPLRHVRDSQADDVLGRPARDARAVEADLAGRPDHAAHRAQRRRLTGPVGAEDRRDPAVLDGEPDPVQHLGPAVPGLEVRDLQERHQTASAPTRASVPRKARITSGFLWTSAGRPWAILRPKSSTTTLSETCMTSPMWCSTSSTVTPRESRIARRSFASVATSSWFRPPAGSSTRRSRGRDASARASSTRLSVPKGNPAAGWSASAPRSRNRRSSVARSRGAASSRPTHRSQSAFDKTSLPVRQWTPTMTFWSTVSVGKNARFWNGRPMPSAAMRWADSPRIGRPSKRTSPPSGVSRRVRQLKSGVLPAPFGPMRPTIRPSSTSQATESSARMPPKRPVRV